MESFRTYDIKTQVKKKVRMQMIGEAQDFL